MRILNVTNRYRANFLAAQPKNRKATIKDGDNRCISGQKTKTANQNGPPELEAR